MAASAVRHRMSPDLGEAPMAGFGTVDLGGTGAGEIEQVIRRSEDSRKPGRPASERVLRRVRIIGAPFPVPAFLIWNFSSSASAQNLRRL
jgi:hypothetical protein